MQPPKYVSVQVTLIPVACDVIAQLGDYLEVRNGVVIGVYAPGKTIEADTPKPVPAPVKKKTNSHSNSNSNSNSNTRIINAYPEISENVILSCVKNLTDPTISQIGSYVRERGKTKAANYVFRDRLDKLIRQGRVEKFKPDGGGAFRFRASDGKPPNLPLETKSEIGI